MKKPKTSVTKQRGLARAGRWTGKESAPYNPFWMPWQGSRRTRPQHAGKGIRERIHRNGNRWTVEVGTRKLSFSSQIVAEQFLETLANKENA